VKYERYKDSKKKLQKKNNEIRFKRLKITISPLIFLYVYVVQTKKIKIKKEEEEEDNDAKSIFFFLKLNQANLKYQESRFIYKKPSRIKIFLDLK
jgi:hypothetical protein